MIIKSNVNVLAKHKSMVLDYYFFFLKIDILEPLKITNFFENATQKDIFIIEWCKYDIYTNCICARFKK